MSATIVEVERLVLACQGGWDSSSARYRLGPLAREGPWPVEAYSAGSFPSREQIESLLDHGGPDAALILQRVLPAEHELRALKRRYARLVFDIDDAIYAVPPDVTGLWIAQLPKRCARLLVRGSPHASARKRPLVQALRMVDVCVVGNAVLGEVARRYARRVIEIPTTVEPVSIPPPRRNGPPIVVWMGLPDNLQYLHLIERPLERLARDLDFRLRVVSTRNWNSARVPVEFVAWSADGYREALLSASAGIAPLTDDPWTRGKCAFRSIQYGGHALPTVATPVGITDRVVLHGTTGFLARSDDEWETFLRTLIREPETAAEMGRAALAHISRSYSDERAVHGWRELIGSL